jgi:hypothetical protein
MAKAADEEGEGGGRRRDRARDDTAPVDEDDNVAGESA